MRNKRQIFLVEATASGLKTTKQMNLSELSVSRIYEVKL